MEIHSKSEIKHKTKGIIDNQRQIVKILTDLSNHIYFVSSADPHKLLHVVTVDVSYAILKLPIERFVACSESGSRSNDAEETCRRDVGVDLGLFTEALKYSGHTRSRLLR